MLEGILIGGAGGTIAGLAIWLIQLLTMKVTERADKKEYITAYLREQNSLSFQTLT